METLKKELDKKKEQATALDKWAIEVMQSQQGENNSLKENVKEVNLDILAIFLLILIILSKTLIYNRPKWL